MKTASKTATPLEEQIKPELLPVDLGGGDIQFVKRSDYAKRTADVFALKHKAEVKRDHVTQLLDALDKGQRDIDAAANPEEIVKLFHVVLEDYNAGVEKVKSDKQAEKDAKDKADREAKEKQEKEEQLFTKMKDANPDLVSLSSIFDVGNMDRFTLKPGVTASDEDLLGALGTGLKMGDFNGWMVGDLVVQLEDRGLLNVVSRMAESAGQSYGNVYNNAKTARFVKPDDRRKGVSFTLYRELATAKFSEEEKKKVPALLAAVNEGKHNSQTVREEVRKIKGKEEPQDVLPEDNEKKPFIVIDPGLADDASQHVTISTGFPKELVGGGVTIIDPVTKMRFTTMSKKPENRWEAVPAYVSAKEREAAEAAAAAEQKKKDEAAAAKAAKKGGKKK